MAIPRVFISSTCYDLKHIRENLKYFVRTVGYEPVLSDEGDVFYSPIEHTHDSCLKEVETCQIFILVIGGRYGGKFKESETSITNSEYKEAVRRKIPVFTLVESGVYSDHHVFTSNRAKDPELANKIDYPSIDNVKIFSFIDEVRRNNENNAIFAFKDFSDMEQYLKKQWAGMMFDFLQDRSNKDSARVTNRLLDDLALATRKSEELIKVLLRSNQGERADEEIREVDKKIEAESFIKLLMEEFVFFNASDELIENFKSLPLAKNWQEYICQSNFFHIEDIEDIHGEYHKVLWGPGGQGLGLGEFVDDEFVPEDRASLAKAYESFKKIDPVYRGKLIELFGGKI